ncbi:transposase family protein, partial [Deinococcus marmoris]|uniref:transposase family protein n=1 Tax=Deinococcus marmoris TaxID=249408 RepID=UPI0011151910
MVGTLKYHQALKLNRTSFRRLTGVSPETFSEMEAVLQGRHANKVKSGRPPALPLGAQLLMTLEFWREYRTLFHIGQDWGVHEATVQRTVVRAHDALIQSEKFSLPGKKALIDHG